MNVYSLTANKYIVPYYKWGIDILTLSKLLGHATLQQTEEYIKITSTQAADKAAEKMLE